MPMLKIEPTGATLGAVVTGVSLADLDKAALQSIHREWVANDPQRLIEFYRKNPNDAMELQSLSEVAKKDPALAIGRLQEMIARGIDMFDCVLPTRLARHGTAFTMDGPVHIKGKRFEFDHGPLDAECSHPLTADFSRAYIRHLFRSGEILGLRLICLHNLHFYLSLARRAREAIVSGTFPAFRAAFVSQYTSSVSDATPSS